MKNVDVLFKIPILNFFIKDFKLKQKQIEKVLKKYPEHRLNGPFFTNRGETDISFMHTFNEIFKKEFEYMCQSLESNLVLTDVWSVSYKKGDYHVPHNHGSKGYSAILYLRYDNNHPSTVYFQPWNDVNDVGKFETPEVKEGSIVVFPSFVEHMSRPNPISKHKRIISFDLKV
tara:strand:- start:79 stop:597 length:519 start_codon:yes stop_codon:yes gene_type:complete